MSRATGIRATVGLLLFCVLYFAAWLGRYGASAPYRAALAYVAESDTLRRALGGEPVVGRFPRGGVDDDGNVEYALRLRGPAATLTLELELEEAGRTWRVIRAAYRTESGGDLPLPAEDGERIRSATSDSNRGFALYQSGRLEEALEVFDRAVALDSANPVTLHWRAWVHHDLGDFERAAADAARAIALDSLYGDAHYALAVAEYGRGEHEASVRHFGHAIELLDHGLGHAYLGRAMARLEIGQHEAALEDLDRACALGRQEAC